MLDLSMMMFDKQQRNVIILWEYYWVLLSDFQIRIFQSTSETDEIGL